MSLIFLIFPTSGTSESGSVAGFVVGVGLLLLCLSIAFAVIMIIRQRKKKLSKPKEDARSEINPVYGTYEVSSDPLAEVGYQLQQG